MVDITQVLLVVVVLTLTIVLTIIGIQFALILREVRRTIEKVGPILDNVAVEQGYINDILKSVKGVAEKVSTVTTMVSENVTQPLTNILSLFKGVTSLFGGLQKFRKPHKEG